MFDDTDNVCYTDVLPDTHSDFAEEIELKFNPKCGRMTADNVKDNLGNTRATLIKIVPKWEQSGKGLGARTESDEDHGRINAEIVHEHGNRRASFLQGFKSHVLHFWNLCDNQGMLQKVLSVSDEEISANRVQNQRDMKKKKAEEKEKSERQKLRHVVGSAVQSLAVTSLATELRESEKELQLLHSVEENIKTVKQMLAGDEEGDNEEAEEDK